MSAVHRTHASLSVLGGRDILFVMAAEAEYGPHLKQRFEPFITGVGPVEAAVELTAALAALDRRERLHALRGAAGRAARHFGR